VAGAKQPTPTMSRRGDGGGNRGVRTENSISSKEEAAKTKQTAAEVWYYSKSYSVMQERHEKHSSQWKGM